MPSTEFNPKGERLEARVSSEQKRLFKRAAQLQGSTLTDFVVSTLQAVATKVVKEHDEVMVLDEQDSKIFLSALLDTELPSGRLKKAAEHYKKIMD
ncbi:DUF1778 domain-containing protein [Candidatus Magnetominusculus xianensis]|uniref:DUF1778 domain-containing protein n=1 Tax=Candidatus Magnetominusculus xianensis TaxID=1748249 RepID=A0ABR5SBT5_9BACT|nr:DUF1778 domain-containing protein [Candidatus Magnetominusculus xianensis]KWT78280.1 hypothetical protein ASN18_2885 [Candidatus Magnetominusculus xianensis]MBF0404031.1 DUF1778 domain-containing protein [Nitrospirota bacterium]